MGTLEDFLENRPVDNSPAYAQAQQSQSSILHENITSSDCYSLKQQIDSAVMQDVFNYVTVGAYELSTNICSLFNNTKQSNGKETKAIFKENRNTFTNIDNPEADDYVSNSSQYHDAIDPLEYDAIQDLQDDICEEDDDDLTYQHTLSRKNKHNVTTQASSDLSESDDEDRDAEYRLIDDLINLIQNVQNDEPQKQENDSNQDQNYSSYGLRRRK